MSMIDSRHAAISYCKQIKKSTILSTQKIGLEMPSNLYLREMPPGLYKGFNIDSFHCHELLASKSIQLKSI